MFNLSAVPEIGLGSKTICDICMRNQSSSFYDCGLHKMCNTCHKRFPTTTTCPLCSKCNQRVIEKTMGKNPQSTPLYFQEPCPLECEHEEDDNDLIFVHSSSEGSLINSISSELSSDSDDINNFNGSEHFDNCGDDLFASLDAEFEKQQTYKAGVSYNGLYHCSCSVYDSLINDDYCPCDDHLKNILLPSTGSQAINAAFVSCGPLTRSDNLMNLSNNNNNNNNNSNQSQKRVLQKSKHISSTDFQHMIDICKDL